MEAGMLNCPSCGAAVSQDSPQCQYCHALLQTVACAKCMGMMFMGSKFCPHCGAGVEQVAGGDTVKKACPRCNTDLMDVKVGTTPLEECGKCGGLWVDVKNFDSICSNAEAQTAALGLEIPKPVEIDAHVRYLKCPQCSNMMGRMNYAGRSGVVIQVCRPHGIWLDRDEMRQIIEFIRGGGLDRARQLEVQQLEYERAQLGRERTAPCFNDLSLEGSIGLAANGVYATNLISGLAAVVGHLR
jgi:Zn-finger nucleic acid-binding protein